jgi:uncharacterized protein
MIFGLDGHTLVLLALATAAGAFVQATTGFGFSLVAAPIFLAALDSTAAIQVLVALHIPQSIMVVPKLVGQAPPALLRRLIVGSLIGFPIGLLVFVQLDVMTLKLAVGVMMLAFTALIIARDAGWIGRAAATGDGRTSAVKAAPALAATTVGAASGFLTSVLVMPGPPLILYLLSGAVGKVESRATSLTFFGFCYVTVTALHALFGGMTAREWLIAALLAPIVVVATIAGTRVAGRLSERVFRWAVLATLVVSGAYAVWSSL